MCENIWEHRSVGNKVGYGLILFGSMVNLIIKFGIFFQIKLINMVSCFTNHFTISSNV